MIGFKPCYIISQDKKRVFFTNEIDKDISPYLGIERINDRGDRKQAPSNRCLSMHQEIQIESGAQC